MNRQSDFSTGNIQSASEAISRPIHELGAMFGQFQKNKVDAEERAQRTKERQQDVDFRNTQALKAEDQWNKSFGIQQAQESRAVTEQAAKEATRQAYGRFGELATAPNQTQAQVAKLMDPDAILAKAQAQGRVLTPQEEALVSGQVRSDLTKNKGSLTQQRQLLLEQAPVTTLYDTVKDPTTGLETVRTRGDIDTSLQQAYKQSLVDNLDKRIGDEASNTLKREEMLATQRYRDKSLALEAGKNKDKFTPYNVTVGFDSSGNPTSDTSKIATKSAITIVSPSMEAAVGRGYKGAYQLGTVTDFKPDTAGIGKYKDVKSVYGSPELTKVADTLGGWDKDRLMKPLADLQNAYKGLVTPGELTNIGLTSVTDRGTWGDRSVDMGLMKRQVVDAILNNPKNKDSEATLEKAVGATMRKYW